MMRERWDVERRGLLRYGSTIIISDYETISCTIVCVNLRSQTSVQNTTRQAVCFAFHFP